MTQRSLAPRLRRGLPTLALLMVTASWGSTFFLIKDLLNEISVVDFLAIRFAIAGAVAFAIGHRAVFRLSRHDVRQAAILGSEKVMRSPAPQLLLQTVGPGRTQRPACPAS